jgi:transposase
VARRPSVFVRPLSMDEGGKLARITRSAKNPVRLRRAIVVLMSAQGQTVRDITSLLPVWSLAKLREHLLAEGVVAEISRETLRRILRQGVSWQTTTTWKASTDPDIMPKMRRILDLYDHPPADGRVVCVDEFGPLNLLPRKGKAWRPQRRPRRQRATYTRMSGVMHMLAALDLATGRLFYRIRHRKRWLEFLDLLKVLRSRWPGERRYVVCDNFSPHRHARVRDWCQHNQIELVFLPTYGSSLNRIEAEFAALRYFALNGTDHRSHDEQNAAIGSYVRWRNARAKPKTNFAVGSPIRTWTSYPVKAA